MTLTKAKDPKASHFGDYKRMRAYMRHELYWHNMFNEACIMIAKFEVDGPWLPTTFETWYKAQRKIHVVEAFSHILTCMKSAAESVAVSELSFSTKRLVYRY